LTLDLFIGSIKQDIIGEFTGYDARIWSLKVDEPSKSIKEKINGAIDMNSSICREMYIGKMPHKSSSLDRDESGSPSSPLNTVHGEIPR
jgi:hypothetical protein